MNSTVGTRPLCFMDVDGVLNRLVSGSVARKKSYVSRSVFLQGFRYRIHLDPENDLRRVKELEEHFQMAWGTTWENAAPELLSPVLGFGEDWPVAVNRGPSASKAPGILELAGTTPFVWLEDEADLEDKSYLKDSLTKSLIVEVNGEEGLTDRNVEEALVFLEELKGEDNG